MNEYMHI